jgi:hypothetical protein
VLASSGLIAGGAIGGTALALVSGVSEDATRLLSGVGALVPAISGSDALALAAFLALATWLWAVGREKLLAPR